ncbi:hypothetical protein FB382_003770 [Nocardioides ginsengisegetis]|uniref:Uncharacterized protein n=1 Tax=Nocardioides ginsengisegetis TaxID=661491 RepID=A0A7W3J3J3_9ACTN|nr:hypothetical protein [Nocardioides ginsengisegetis]MBA8805479.1 hypothetical protein [Nocardioides ginsengisegetis]
MKDWTDDDLAVLLKASMAARERDIDPERARELAQSARPARRRWPAVVAAAAAVALLSGLTAYVAAHNAGRGPSPAGQAPSSSPTVGSGDIPQGTTEENRRRAVAASEATLAAFSPPEGSARLEGQPEGWPAGGMTLGASDLGLSRTAWWSVPMSKAEVVAYLSDHSPAGMLNRSGVSDPSGGGIASTSYETTTSPDPAAFTAPLLLVQFMQMGDRTVLRVDTFLAARYAVPDEARIPPDVSVIRIDRVAPLSTRGGQGGDPYPAPVRLTRPADTGLMDDLVAGFNALYGSITASGYVGCPAPSLPLARDTVTFQTADTNATPHTIVAELEPDCRGQVRVSLDGTQLPVTLDPGGWDQLVNDTADQAN